MSSEKRKKVLVSMKQKREALQRLNKGETVQKVAEEYGVGLVFFIGLPYYPTDLRSHLGRIIGTLL
jgi:hypothetical protein